MKNSNTDSDEGTANNRRGVGLDYVKIGTDTASASRIHCTFDEMVVVIQNGELAEWFDVADSSVEDYVKFFRDAVTNREWTGRDYFADGEGPFTELVTNVSTEVST